MLKKEVCNSVYRQSSVVALYLLRNTYYYATLCSIVFTLPLNNVDSIRHRVLHSRRSEFTCNQHRYSIQLGVTHSENLAIEFFNQL